MISHAQQHATAYCHVCKRVADGGIDAPKSHRKLHVLIAAPTNQPPGQDSALRNVANFIAHATRTYGRHEVAITIIGSEEQTIKDAYNAFLQDQRKPPDLLITEYKERTEQAIKLLKMLQAFEERWRCPVIVFGSGDAEKVTRRKREVLRLGAFCYTSKVVTLLEEVHSVLASGSTTM